MNAAVTNRQIFFILLLIITCDSLIHIPKDAIKASGTGAWISIALLTVIFAAGIYLFARLNSKFENKTIFEYSKILLVKPLSFIIGLIYSLYFLVILIVIYRDVAVFIKEMFLHLTPVWALVFLGIIMSIYIASKGITNIGRLCEIYGITLIAIAFLIHFTMLFIGDIKNIEPFFNAKETGRYIWGMKDLIFYFLGIEVLAVIPFNKAVNKKAALYSVLAVIFIGIFYIVIVETSVMVVGINDILNYDASLVTALRQTKLPKSFLLERADLLFLTVGIAAIIGGTCTLYCISSDCISKLLPKLNRNIILCAVGVIVLIASSVLINDEQAKLLSSVIIPICGMFVAFIMPLMLLIISKVKKYEY